MTLKGQKKVNRVTPSVRQTYVNSLEAVMFLFSRSTFLIMSSIAEICSMSSELSMVSNSSSHVSFMLPAVLSRAENKTITLLSEEVSSHISCMCTPPL